ncbi:hypothetical protein [Embleya hyalina]|uniref:Uncharacterized protein n=1 Tax=Embleya hyalina TaxID=516124 RepID=A0A401YUP6_9ACTN|nr:hypothetical protein [Embleya hyalina]GCD98332.1 hypothetical protein EHYA_06038 [Embleya hyalina]
MTRPDFVVTATGDVVPVIEARTLPPREELRRAPERIKVGDWVAPRPGFGHDAYLAGRVERAENSPGLDNDQVVIVLPPGGMPYMLKGSELYRAKPPS